MLLSFLATQCSGVFNGVMPIGLRCAFAAIKAIRLKLEASLYVHGARFGARVLRWVGVAKPLLPAWAHTHIIFVYVNLAYQAKCSILTFALFANWCFTKDVSQFD